jgi:hypothetical protein
MCACGLFWRLDAGGLKIPSLCCAKDGAPERSSAKAWAPAPAGLTARAIMPPIWGQRMLDFILSCFLGVITVAIAVLGGFISSSNRRYRIAFYVLGAISVLLIVIMGYRTFRDQTAAETARQELSSSVDSLGRAAGEISRVQGLNTQLQQRLLEQSQNITSLAEENISQVTGRGTFSYFVVAPNLGAGDPITFPLQVFVRGKYPMREVSSSIQRAGNFAITGNLIQPTLPLAKTLLPGVSPVDYRLGVGEYHIQTWCAAGGPINESIRLAMIDGQLDQQIEVWGWGKQLYKLGSAGLGFPEPKPIGTGRSGGPDKK